MKIYLDELIKQLESLKEEDHPTFGKVVTLVVKTAIDQKLTYDVKRYLLECLLSLDGLTPDEAKLLQDLDEAHKAKTQSGGNAP